MASFRMRQSVSVSLCALLLLTAVGCDVQIGDWGQARYERIVDRSAALSAGATLDVHTSSGAITIAGTGGTGCEVTATISDATCGKCEASSSYGTVSARNLDGQLAKLHSGSGSVNVTGGRAETLDLSSSYGRVKALRMTTGNLKAHSGSGGIHVDCAPACPPELKAGVKTSCGSLAFVAPPAFSGRVHLATNHGSVQTERPITIGGEVTKKKIAGTIGDGDGNLRLETSSGSTRFK